MSLTFDQHTGTSTVISVTSDDESIPEEPIKSRIPGLVERSIGSGFDEEEETKSPQRRHSEGSHRIAEQEMSKISRRPSRRNSRQGMLSMKQMTELARNAKNPDEVLGLDEHFRRGSSIESSVSNSSFQSLGTNLAGSTLPRRSPFGGGGSGDADISGGSSTGDASEMNSVLREVLTRLKTIERRLGVSAPSTPKR